MALHPVLLLLAPCLEAARRSVFAFIARFGWVPGRPMLPSWEEYRRARCTESWIVDLAFHQDCVALRLGRVSVAIYSLRCETVVLQFRLLSGS